MKRVVLVLELLEDEADLIVAAASKTNVKFAGFPLGEMMEMSRAGQPRGRDGSEGYHFISEGAQYLGQSPVTLEGLLK